MSNRKIIFSRFILAGLLYAFHVQDLMANPTTVAACKNPAGWGYYHSGRLVPPSKAGWVKDEINPGSHRLIKLPDGTFDIEVVDANQTPFTVRGDGGELLLMRAGPDDATFLHFVRGKVIELYTFWRGSDGKLRFDLLQSKGGGISPIHKSSVMVGECPSIRFDLLQ